jgi:hypothetical protein
MTALYLYRINTAKRMQRFYKCKAKAWLQDRDNSDRLFSCAGACFRVCYGVL